VATEPDEIDALAGEYVLGTLGAEERRAAAARVAADPAFAVAVAIWERRLQPLADAAAPVAPHAATFDTILARIDALQPDPGTTVVLLRRRLVRWRMAAAIAAIAAAVLLAVVASDRVRAPQTRYVAMLTPSGGTPAFVLTVDTSTSTLTIRRVADPAPAGKSYELWAVEPGQDPKSLGVVSAASYTRPLAVPTGNLVLAVSLEPAGGSPTGKVTGPVVFSGPLVKAN
jgi:anti-sigma-K factor RskA